MYFDLRFLFSALVAVLKHCALESLTLVGIPLTSEHVQQLATATMACPTLQRLTLSECGLDDDGCEGEEGDEGGIL